MQKRNSQTRINIYALFFALFAATFGGTAYAQTSINIATVNNGDSGANWSFDGVVLTVKDGANIIVTGNVGNTRRIVVADNAAATVTLDGVSITYVDASAIHLGNGADLKLILAAGSNNKLIGGDGAGIYTTDAKLTIDGTGTLYAEGSINYGDCYPGIGGNPNGTVIINGGTVEAKGANDAAGIGGGQYYGGGHDGGIVEINGGTVTATGGNYGAGIGGSRPGGSTPENPNGLGGTVTINGGTVVANAGGRGTPAAIGGGDTHSNTGTVTINGGSVKMNNHNGPQPKNSSAADVYLNTLTVGIPPVGDKTAFTAGVIGSVSCDATNTPPTTGYGIIDVKTDADSKVYFWLPVSSGEELVSLTSNSTATYIETYTRVGNNNNVETLASPYGFQLSETGTHTFSEQDEGYTMQESFTVTVTSTGIYYTGELTLALSGDGAVAFELSQLTISNINSGSNASFDVRTQTGIPAGTYTATVTVSGIYGISFSFDVSFTVLSPIIDLSTDTVTKGAGWTYANDVYTINDNANVTVVKSNSGSNRRIVVAAGATATATLKDATITNPNNAAIRLNSGADLTLTLAEGSNNTLSGSGNDGSAGIYTTNAKLTINGSGTLNANGAMHWPGIGGNPNGTVIIDGGTVNAQGGDFASGIGGSNGYAGGIITINGGTVTATGGSGAAGIGGGDSGGAGGTVTITGGTITATKGSSSDRGDIGPGHSSPDGTITITGGSVKCTSAMPVPQPTNGAGKNVYLNTLTVGDPPAQQKNAAITAGNISGMLCATTPNAAAGVYGINDVKTDGDGIVYFWLPETTSYELVELDANSNKYKRAYTRAADNSNAKVLSSHDLYVAGVNSDDTNYVAWDGNTLTFKKAGTYDVFGTTVVENIVVQPDGSNPYNITLNGVSITSGACAFDMAGATVDLTLVGNNTLKSGSYRAGLRAPLGATLTIDGAGTITASCNSGGAGIGGNQYEAGGTVTITGGTVNANSYSYGAGIGGGEDAAGGIVTITGGTVNAFSGSFGAGIGKGGANASVGTVIITGGTVNATGGEYGMGIGGSSGTVIISGGTVTATSGEDGTDIDVGVGTVTITGGSVKVNNYLGPQPTNGAGKNVYLNTLTINNPPVDDDKAIVKGSINGVACNVTPNAAGGVYGINDVKTRDGGIVYFWLPATGNEGTDKERVMLAVDNTYEYANTFARAKDNNTTATLLLPYATPNAGIDYVNEKLTGLNAGAEYSFNNDATSGNADGSGEYPIDPDWFNTILSIVQKGDGSGSDSEAQQLPIPARPSAPPGLCKTDQTTAGLNDGTITDVSVSPAMEYQKNGDSGWTACTGTSITGLAPETYRVRYMAIVNSAFASEAAVVHINAMQIGDDQTVCSGKEPETLKGETVAYGDETYTYVWQQSADKFSWTAILGATEASYTPPAKQDADTTYYRRLASVDVSCSPTYSNEVKITTVSTPTYSDIRLSVCPDAGNINLAKYIDTADVITSIEWKHPFISIPDNAGSISTSALATSRIHTLTYTVSSRCVGAQKRKVYLEVLRNGVTRQPRDTIAICHLYAEAVNIINCSVSKRAGRGRTAPLAARISPPT